MKRNLATILGLSLISTWTIAQADDMANPVNNTTAASATQAQAATATTANAIAAPANTQVSQNDATATPPASSYTSTTPASPLTATPLTIAQQNQQAGTAFLANNKTQPGVVTTADGLQYKIIDPGNGPKPSSSDTVTVDYEGKHLNGQVFDSSYQRGQPATFPVNGVIMGCKKHCL